MQKYFDEYIKYLHSYASPSTIKYYINVFHVFEIYLEEYYSLSIEPALVDKKLVTDFIIYLRSHVSDTSVRTYIRGLKAFFNYLLDNDIVTFNPFKKLKLPISDTVASFPLSQEEVRQCLNYIDTHMCSFRNQCIFQLMLELGLRRQEVLHLKISDIDLDKSFLVIRLSKYNKTRCIPIPKYLNYNLKNYIKRCNHHDYVFTNLDGTPITEHCIINLFHDLKSVVPRIHPHLLRHTFATSYIMHGGSLETLRFLMGHSSYTVTQTYINQSAQLSIIKYPIYPVDDVMFTIFSSY